MKQKLLTIALVLLSFFAKAQCSPDAAITQTGIYPPGSTTWDPSKPSVMPNAMEGKAYSEVVQVKAPKDTVVPVFGVPTAVTIDSLTFLSITGIPSSLTYQCDNADCFWLGGANGCFTLSGTPSMGDAGKYSASINAYGWVDIGFGPQGDSIEFFMDITIDAFVGLEEESIKESFKISPNPVVNSATVNFNATERGSFSFKIVDVTGRTVIQNSGLTQSGLNKINFERNDLPEGVYIYLIETGDFRKSGRLIFAN